MLNEGGKRDGKVERAKQGLVPGEIQPNLIEGGACRLSYLEASVRLLNFPFRQSLA